MESIRQSCSLIVTNQWRVGKHKSRERESLWKRFPANSINGRDGDLIQFICAFVLEMAQTAVSAERPGVCAHHPPMGSQDLLCVWGTAAQSRPIARPLERVRFPCRELGIAPMNFEIDSNRSL
jgi:hypothetical protein